MSIRQAFKRFSIGTTSSDKSSTASSGKNGTKSNGSSNHVKAVGEKAGHAINGIFGKSVDERYMNDQGEPMSKNQLRKQEKLDKKREQRLAREKVERELQQQRQEEDERAAKEEPEEQRARHGYLPINQSQSWPHDQRFEITSITPNDEGKEVAFRARLHTYRAKSAKLAFAVFRQKTDTIQGVLEQKEGEISEYMIRWTGRINVESVLLVKGVVQKPKEEVHGTSIHDAELRVTSVHVVSEASDTLPFDVYHAEQSALLVDPETDEEDPHITRISNRTRLENRVLDLRTSTAQAIFRINAGICNLFRTHLDSLGFIEIHTPKLQGGATESGASVFELQYFGRPAFLAQSPQLAKQMCISADFERVYEIGPVFRAENSNTHRHLTEYTGLDIEMAFEEHYHEVVKTVDETLKSVFKGVYERYEKELEIVKRQFHVEKLKWLDETLILPFKDGIKLLKDSGYEDCSENDDLSTRAEIRLGELVKEKYHTDYYILDKFPTSARPFYTMLDPQDDRFTNSFDIFLRGQEITSGGQRIHNLRMLENRMQEQGLRTDAIEEYMEAFRWGAPPHGGAGLGLERVVMLLLGLGNVRHASLFPRDPKSLPLRQLGEDIRHLEASTLHPPWEGRKDAAEEEEEFQPLEKLIANYGDASNTAWLDERYEVWRHDQTGAAVGYIPSGHYAVILGDPLCNKCQYAKVTGAFLRFLKKDLKLKPLWLLVNQDMEDVLGGKLGWRSLTCVSEARVDPNVDPKESGGVPARKIRHAQREDVTIAELPAGEPIPEDIRAEADQRMKDWLDNRKGAQVHITELNPWVDQEHRRYLYARDKEGKMCALVVLAQLAPANGYQVKYALDFPGAPGGSIELIITSALKVATEAGAKSVTFGGTASNALRGGHNMGGLRLKILAQTYHAISMSLNLNRKGEFREKLGAEHDPIYICYPKNGMGPGAVQAIMNCFKDGEA